MSDKDILLGAGIIAGILALSYFAKATPEAEAEISSVTIIG